MRIIDKIFKKCYLKNYVPDLEYSSQTPIVQLVSLEPPMTPYISVNFGPTTLIFGES